MKQLGRILSADAVLRRSPVVHTVNIAYPAFK